MTTLLTIVHVLVCVFLIAIVLLQHGKGADAGAAFGGGSSQSLFGTEGPLSLLNKITTVSAVVFMVTSVALAYLASMNSSGSVMSEVETPAAPPVAEQVIPSDQEVAPTAPATQEFGTGPVAPAGE